MSCLLIAVQQKKTQHFQWVIQPVPTLRATIDTPEEAATAVSPTPSSGTVTLVVLKWEREKKKYKRGSLESQRERESDAETESCFAADFRAHTNENLRKVTKIIDIDHSLVSLVCDQGTLYK